MIKGFKEFLLKNNVLALAVAVIVGGAVGKVVSSLAADIIMPLIGLVLPGGDWRTAKLVLSTTMGPDGKEVVNAINYGTFLRQRGGFHDHRVRGLHDDQGADQGSAAAPPAAFEELPALQGSHRHRRHQVQVLHRGYLGCQQSLRDLSAERLATPGNNSLIAVSNFPTGRTRCSTSAG